MRVPSLDGLRAISIILVLFAHLSGTRHFVRSNLFEIYGNVGVRIFFVISGFLITTLLLNERERTGTISLRDFYVRRAYRILPAAYAYMLLVLLLHWNALSGANAFTALSYTSNYYPQGAWLFGHLWSLSVEEQFYLLWPLALLLCFRVRMGLLVAVLAAGPPLRVAFWLLWGRRGLEHPFPVVMDALATGCLLAIVQPKLQRYSRILQSRWLLIVPALTLLLPLTQVVNNRLYQVFGLTLLHLGIAVSLEHAVRCRYAVLNARWVVWLGVLSYSLYLWQQPFLSRQGSAVWNAFPLNLVLALLFACASHYGVERPFLSLRARRSATRGESDPGRPAPAGRSLPLAS